MWNSHKFLWNSQGFTLSSLDAFSQYGALNVQAGTVFCDAEFQREARVCPVSPCVYPVYLH